MGCPRHRTSRPDVPVAGPHGVVVVDKPAGWTSHDVVARIRRLAGTRKVGHAGTLDPMATGVLVVGLGRATRLLGFLAAGDKDYRATIRLGEATVTDDAQGEVTAVVSARGVGEREVREAVRGFVGVIQQVPSAVSAVKVDGERSYRRVRAGQDVQLAAREVTVARFDVLGVDRPDPARLDVEVEVSCSTGTYVRALARDVGAVLGVGGHLTALRRTRVGGFGVDEAATLDELEREFRAVALGDAVARAFPRREVGAAEADSVAHGRPIARAS
ncbi:MAG: tRNA pseudouridine(55) synthase TruB, partial [Actinomycetota bacterium]|nr:tRNA pseudouridine(55) synthase TruB [Actinomycetota bacterium]